MSEQKRAFPLGNLARTFLPLITVAATTLFLSVAQWFPAGNAQEKSSGYEESVLARSRSLAQVLLPDAPALTCSAELIRVPPDPLVRTAVHHRTDGDRSRALRRWAVQCEGDKTAPFVHLMWDADTHDLLSISQGNQWAAQPKAELSGFNSDRGERRARQTAEKVLQAISPPTEDRRLVGQDVTGKQKSLIFHFYTRTRSIAVHISPWTGDITQIFVQNASE